MVAKWYIEVQHETYPTAGLSVHCIRALVLKKLIFSARSDKLKKGMIRSEYISQSQG